MTLLKLSTNAIGMLISKYRSVLKKMFLKNFAVLAASCLIFSASPALAAEYEVGTGKDYANLDALRTAVETGAVAFADGDTVTMYNGGDFLTGTLNFQDKTVTIRPGPAVTDIQFLSLNNQSVTLENASNVTVTGFTNTTGDGGAVYLSGGTLTANNATFSGNTASGDGGAIYANNSTVNLGADAGRTSIFSGNKAGATPNSIFFFGYNNTTVLKVTGEGTLDMRDPLNSVSESYNLNITKTGTGDWKLRGVNSFNTNAASSLGTTFKVNEGTLDLYNGAKITITKGSFTLGDSIAGTNGTLISRGGNTITAPTIILNSGSTLGFDLTNANNNTTNLILTGGGVSSGVNIDIMALNGDGGSHTYQLLTASGGVHQVQAELKPTIRGEEFQETRLSQNDGISRTADGKTLLFTTTAKTGEVTWTGGENDGNKWNATSKNWDTTAIDNDTSHKFLHGDAVIFADADGGTIDIQKTGVQVTKRGNNPGLTINSGDWTFTGGKIEGGEIKFTGDGSITFGADTGTDPASTARSLEQRITVADNKKAKIAAVDGETLYFNGFDTTAEGTSGGAIYAGSGATVELGGDGSAGNVVFQNNQADDYGAAINSKGSILISGGTNTFSHNSAGYGGAIYGYNNVAISGGTNTFSNNSADKGGAIYVCDNLTLAADAGDITFQGNTASGQPNAVFMENDDNNKTLALAAKDSYAIYFYDPVESKSSEKDLIISINEDSSTGETYTGTVLFDKHHSEIYGKTTVYNGTMALTNSVTYGASNTVGTFTLEGGATLLSDANASANKIQANTITLEDGSILSFDLTGAVAQGETGSTLNLTLTAQPGSGDISKDVTIDIASLYGAGTFNLVTTTGSVLSDQNKLTLLGTEIDQTRADGYLTVAGGNTMQFTNDSQNGVVTWTGNDAANPTLWNATAQNWDTTNIDNNLSHKFLHGDAAVFDGTGETITVQDAGVQIANHGQDTPGLTVETGDWTFEGGGTKGIFGTGGLLKKGDGVLTLKNTNTYTGGTVIEDGILTAQHAAALGTGEIINSATLEFNLAQDGEVVNQITNNGELVKSGATTLTLTNGDNNYAGGITTIHSGVLEITAPAGGLLTFGDINNYSSLKFISGSSGFTQKTIDIASYSGSGVVGLQAVATAQAKWSDLLNFTNTPAGVNVYFYFSSGSSVIYMPDDGLHFASLSAADGAADTFRLDGNGAYNLAGAYQLGIKTDDYQNYNLVSTFNPSLAKVYSEASAATLGQAAWMHNKELFKAAKQAAGDAGKNVTGIYAGFGRTDMRHKTGSHADVDGNTLSIALAWKASDQTAWGLFGQRFRGDYETSHDAALSSGRHIVNSDGDLKSHDIGLFAEYRPGGENEAGHYYQAIMRAGRSTNDFRAANAANGSRFSSGRNLFGFSVGGGYMTTASQDQTIDYYSHLIYTRLGGDTVTDSIGQNINFKSSDSVRLLSGMRLNINQNKKTSAYFGAALDYEFRGDANAYVNGLKADSADLKGLTGILDLGLSSKQSDTLTIDLGLQGYVGKKQGLGGTLTLCKKL